MGKGTAAGNSIYRSSVVSLVLLPRKKPHCTLMNDWEVPKNLHFHLFLIIWYTSPNISPPTLEDTHVTKGRISMMLLINFLYRYPERSHNT